MKKPGKKIILEGASGASYPFHVYPLDSQLDPIGGVYVVTKRKEHPDGRRTHSRIYAGQAADLSARLAEHRASSTFRGRRADCVCVLPEDVESRRIEIESDLLSRFRPPGNAK